MSVKIRNVFGFLLLLLYTECRSFRLKRNNGLTLPNNYKPFGEFTPTNQLFPIRPFSHNFGFGVETNPEPRTMIKGGINFPILNETEGTSYPFDLAGEIRTGKENTRVNFGETVNPVNPLEVPIDKIYPCLFFDDCNRQIPLATPPHTDQGAGSEGRLSLMPHNSVTGNKYGHNTFNPFMHN